MTDKFYNKCPHCGFTEETSTENTSILCEDCTKEHTQKYCSKCGRPLIKNIHCPVHIDDMLPITEDDIVKITVKELNALYKNREQRYRLTKSLELKKKQLIYHSTGMIEDRDKNKIDLGYKITISHHLRDIITALAVLNNEPNAEELLKNMPQRK